LIVYVDEDLQDLIPGYLENRKRDVARLTSALDNADFQTIRTIGHQMKGSGGGYGFDRITEIGRALEEAAGRSLAEDIRKQAAYLQDYVDKVQVIFKS
jgi:HPt (histidine-containing phosphotransfer) domain-containing protein